SFYKLNPKLARLKKDNGLLKSKQDHIFDKLCSSRFVMLQAINGLIATILNTCLHREDSRKMIESCLSLVNVYNHLMGLSYKKYVAKFNIGSNTYPTTNLAKSRVEVNCQRLINCLVTVYSPEDNSDADSGSSGEDLEIYQMKQAKSLIEVNNRNNKKLNEIMSGQNSDTDVPYTSLLTNECILENIMNSDGYDFAVMLQELVTLNNQCEVTWDYILGAPIEDLPITRRLASSWEMNDFFRIAHSDMQACMEQLLNLRFADHSVTIEAVRIAHSDMQACKEQLLNLRFADHSVTIEAVRIAHSDMQACMEQLLNLRFADHSLLADFNEVRSWLNECKPLSTAGRKQMLQNEVL
ncbi:Uncharacterized protein OBRU01_18513, partial [Operophtera brumata]